jgi:hypothetical protein
MFFALSDLSFPDPDLHGFDSFIHIPREPE